MNSRDSIISLPRSFLWSYKGERRNITMSSSHQAIDPMQKWERLLLARIIIGSICIPRRKFVVHSHDDECMRWMYEDTLLSPIVLVVYSSRKSFILSLSSFELLRYQCYFWDNENILRLSIGFCYIFIVDFSGKFQGSITVRTYDSVL